MAKEENGLYPLLVDYGDLSAKTSTKLEGEHRCLHAALTHGAFDRRDYYALAAHIEEEEMELFPAAMFAFEDDSWDVMQAAHTAAEAAHSMQAGIDPHKDHEDNDPCGPRSALTLLGP